MLILACGIVSVLMRLFDGSLTEQVSKRNPFVLSVSDPGCCVCIRYVWSQSYKVYEASVGHYSTDRTDAYQLTCLIKDTLIRLNLPLRNCRGQCYDDVANMSGRRSGVAAHIQKSEQWAACLYCMGHCFNLAVQDTCRSFHKNYEGCT